MEKGKKLCKGMGGYIICIEGAMLLKPYLLINFEVVQRHDINRITALALFSKGSFWLWGQYHSSYVNLKPVPESSCTWTIAIPHTW